MKAAKSVQPAGGAGDVGDREGGGVAGKDGVPTGSTVMAHRKWYGLINSFV